MQVQRWGDSLAVRLPDDLVRDLRIEEGDEIDIETDGGKWHISRGTKHRAALDKLEALAVIAPGFRFSRSEAHERGDE